MSKRRRGATPQSRGAIASVMALWLFGIFFAMAFRQIQLSGQAALISEIGVGDIILQISSIIWPLFYFLFSSHRFLPKAPPIDVLITFGVFFLFVGLSALVSPLPYVSIGYLAFTIMAIWIVLRFNTNMLAADFDKAFKIYSVLIALSVLVYAVQVYTPGERLGENEKGDLILNPNAIAMVCMSGFIGAFAFQNFFIRMLFVGVNVALVIMTGSRTSTVGCILAVAVFLWSRRREWQILHVIIFWMIIIYLLTVLVIWWNPLMGPVKTYFALQDRSRGLATWGGRFLPWQEAWALFLSHPLLGVGYRVHEELMPINVSAHNGYLAMLAEIGVIGFAALLYPVWKGITFLRRKNTFEPAVSYAILIALCIAYTYLALFERYLINFGNPTSLLFLVAIFSYLIPYGERATWRSSPSIGRTIAT
jgi:hypothetical protein